VLLERDEELAAVETLLSAGGVLVIEGGAGIGKTALVDAACSRAGERGRAVLRARGAELEAGFGFGMVRQLFERRLTGASPEERELLLAGPTEAAWTLLGAPAAAEPADTSFAVLHGLYWLAANLAALQPVVVAVDDAHWADSASLRWLAYLAPRAGELGLSLLVALRPADPAADATALLAVRSRAAVIVRPRLLSEQAIASLAREALGTQVSAQHCSWLKRTSGGNPFYLRELLRAVTVSAASPATADWQEAATTGTQDVRFYLGARLRQLGPAATRLAQALAVLGDGCTLRHAAALAGQGAEAALHVAAALVSSEVLAEADPPRFLHPIVRQAVEASLDSAQRAVLHRAAAGVLHAERAPAGRVAAHLRMLPPAGEAWVCQRLREAASAALASGEPHAAGELLRRAWAEPPPPEEQVALLRELAGADVAAGRGSARDWLEQALARTADPRERARIAMEVARAHASSFRWADAVDVIERAVAELGDADPDLTHQLEGEVVVAGLHDARRAARVGPALSRLAARSGSVLSGEALAVARGMAALLAGRPAAEVAEPLLAALSAAPSPVENWDTRAALLWCLVTAEGFDAVENSIDPMLAGLRRTGSARGLVAVYSALGFLRLRLGALPEADTAARIALRVMQEGDFAPGLPFAVTVCADVAIEAGQLDQAQVLLESLPAAGWSPGVGTVLIPAAWGRLHLAAGRPAEAIAAFQSCAAMFSTDVWGLDIRDVGYLHARSGAAQALLLAGDRPQACQLAEAELADVRSFAAPRALGVALRTAGLADGGQRGLDLLADSVAALADSPAVLERAKSLAELGAAQRRAGQRGAAREHLAEALDLAARCGAQPLAARVREELNAAGARPRRDWRRGVESLTPTELRVARLAADGRTNREIAQTLYVTLKTVEGHLARVYAKLEINGRPQLAIVLGEENPRGPAR
jgi:DNA-binding CsgD family transcriptional regulator